MDENQQREEQDAEVEEVSDEPMHYCPVCNARLISRKCKLICPRCGYFLSCSDFY